MKTNWVAWEANEKSDVDTISVVWAMGLNTLILGKGRWFHSLEFCMMLSPSRLLRGFLYCLGNDNRKMFNRSRGWELLLMILFFSLFKHIESSVSLSSRITYPYVEFAQLVLIYQRVYLCVLC